VPCNVGKNAFIVAVHSYQHGGRGDGDWVEMDVMGKEHNGCQDPKASNQLE